MLEKIYIIGHTSPDLDSVAAAISYADLKNKLEKTNKYVPAMAGAINKETEFILQKFNFAAPEILTNAKGKNIILVDHNEFSQAVNGIEGAKIIEVLDHHKVVFNYSEPIVFRVFPWGASCSIIARMYWDNNIEINKNIAGLMLAAVLVDTVITKSPTCTKIDKEIIEKLSQSVEIKDWRKFGMEIFKVRSSVSELSESEIIKSDYKDFNLAAGKFGIGQVETVDLTKFAGREEALIKELDKLREQNNYHSVILLITDILKQGSTIMAVSDEPERIEKALEIKFENNQAYKEDLMSRKKQVVPVFTEEFDN